MSHHLGPPKELPPIGKLLYVVTFTILFAVCAYFLVPLIDTYVGLPFSEWLGNTIFGPKDAAASP